MLNHTSFLDTFFSNVAAANLDLTSFALDHLAYQANTSQEYEQLKNEWSTDSTLIHEAIVHGRNVAIFKLHRPLHYQHYSIEVLELLEPKVGQVIESGFQHVEFLINTSFEKLMTQYPTLQWDTSALHQQEFSHLKYNFSDGTTIKFLLYPMLELVQP